MERMRTFLLSSKKHKNLFGSTYILCSHAVEEQSYATIMGVLNKKSKINIIDLTINLVTELTPPKTKQ